MVSLPNTWSQTMQLLREGNTGAFNEIYAFFWKKLYGVAYNRLKDKEVVEEILQDIFTELWINREKIEITKSLEAYLGASLKYKIFNYIRHEQVRKNYAEVIQLRLNEASDITAEQLSFEELRAQLEAEINHLPEKCQLVFRLSREQGYSTKEIAQELSISVKTAEVHLGKALKFLRKRLGYFLIGFLLFFLQ